MQEKERGESINMLRLKVLKQLNGRRREEVRELENLCCEHDNIRGGILLAGTEEDEKPKFFLCYEEEALAGFAVLYQMPDGMAEVCGYIHPDHRRRLMIKKMLTAVRREAEGGGAKELHYVCEPHPSGILRVLLQEGDCAYICSEYLMEWKYSYLIQKTNALEVRRIEEADGETAALLLAGAFSMDEPSAEERIVRLQQEGCRYYGAWQRNVPVGIFCLSESEENVYVFDFAVDGDYRGRGIGEALLKELIRIVQEKGLSAAKEESSAPMKKIRIQVGSRNENAFRLYQKNGFQVISQRDYYRVNAGTEE